MIICKKCNKPKTKQINNSYRCIPCHRIYARDYYRNNKGSRKQVAARYYRNNKAFISKIQRNSHLKRNFNLTQDQYNDKLEQQNGVCAICKRAETLIKHNKLQLLSVDHSHKTGKIRGLLCNSCNTGLAQFKDSINRLINAANYLAEHKDHLLKLAA